MTRNAWLTYYLWDLKYRFLGVNTNLKIVGNSVYATTKMFRLLRELERTGK